jgi:hypothetical protein
LPIRRALHGDKGKIQTFMKGEADMKVTNPKFLTRVRNESKLTLRISQLPIMQSNLLLKFLTMNFCLIIDWQGAGAIKVPDACHLCMFMPASLQGGVTVYHKFESSAEIRKAIENLKAVCMDCFRESYHDNPEPFFSLIFEKLKDQLQDEDPDVEILHVHIDYQVQHVEEILVKWSGLYTDEDNEHMNIVEFRDLNIRTLQINTTKWLNNRSMRDMSRIPAQIFAPPGIKKEIVGKVADAGPKRYPREDKRLYQAVNPPKGANPKQNAGGGAKHAVVLPVVPPKQPVGGGQKGLCLKDLLHRKDPSEFPSGCPRPTAQCKFRHAVQLTAAGKLNPGDKAALLTGMGSMAGPFAVQAREYIEAHL